MARENPQPITNEVNNLYICPAFSERKLCPVIADIPTKMIAIKATHPTNSRAAIAYWMLATM